MNASEQQIEREIQAKGHDAPRLTPDHIDRQIVRELYYVFPDTTLTICCLVLRNGFCVVGHSAAASPENFDEEIGKAIAHKNAREQIWALEGYLLKEELHRASPLGAQQVNELTADVAAEILAKGKDLAPVTPTIGRIVLYYEGDWEACGGGFPHAMTGDWESQKAFVERHGAEARGTNGTRLHPAIITNVWGPDCVNLIVFFDAVAPQVKTSMSRLPDEAFADGAHCTNSGWRWPPRV